MKSLYRVAFTVANRVLKYFIIALSFLGALRAYSKEAPKSSAQG